MRFFASLRMTGVYRVRENGGGGWRRSLQPPPPLKTKVSVILSETKWSEESHANFRYHPHKSERYPI